jgi:hypothetical protein
MASIFRKRESDIKGITEIRVDGMSYPHHFCSLPWAPPIVEVKAGGVRVVYMAEACLKALYIDTWGKNGLKYGPGARRVYIKLNEKLVEEILNRALPCPARDDKRMAQYKQDLGNFGLALVDLLAEAA